MLASRFANHSPALRSDYPLSDEQIRRVAPSIFAEAPHDSRSERYAYIPTVEVLTELRKEGFQPFMVCQTRVGCRCTRDDCYLAEIGSSGSQHELPQPLQSGR